MSRLRKVPLLDRGTVKAMIGSAYLTNPERAMNNAKLATAMLFRRKKRFDWSAKMT